MLLEKYVEKKEAGTMNVSGVKGTEIVVTLTKYNVDTGELFTEKHTYSRGQLLEEKEKCQNQIVAIDIILEDANKLIL